MFCGKCGKENLPGVRFCVQCGADLESLTVGSPHTPAPPARASAELAATMDPSELGAAGQLRPGMVLSGQFRIVGQGPLGAGGMGEVWQAEDLELGTAVAVKVLPAMLARNEAAVANLKKEAMIGRQLTHKNICRLHSLHSDGQTKFIVMEFVRGRTLQQLLQDSPARRLPWERLWPLAAQVAEALDYAHGATYTDSAGRSVRGVLHRDIKPGNIMVTDDGSAKLMDFGIAREMHDTMTEVTGRTSQTPLYASPEQFRGASVTAASDIYSFAAVLYECLVGDRYVAAHGDVAWQVLQKPFEPSPALTERLNSGLAAGLAKDPAARPPSAGALVALLAGTPLPAAAMSAAGLSPAAQLASAKTVPAAPAIYQAPAAAAGPKRRKVVLLLAAAAVIIGAGVTLAIVLTRGQSRPRDAGSAIAGAGGSVAGAPGDSVGAAGRSGPSPSPTGASVSASTSAPASGAAPAQIPPPRTGEPPKTFTNSVGMKLIYVPPGEFAMGSPPDEPGRESAETQTRVRLTRGYYLAATEVTQAQWQMVSGDNPSFTKGPDLPVENVSYIKAVEFCEALSRKEGRKYRLPTEAEWEYACRAGTTTPFWTGKALTTDQANFDGTMLEPNAPPGKDRGLTTPVASFPPNPWGFCDMHGNVWEWCANFYGAYPGGEVADPAGPAGGTLMALRGGSWRSKAADCRSAGRYKDKPASFAKHVGFRAAADAGP